MNESLNVFSNIKNKLSSNEMLEDFLYYLGISNINENISNDEMIDLIDYCKTVRNKNIDPYVIARDLTLIIYKYRNSITLENIKRIPSDSIEYYYESGNISELEDYFEDYEETLTSTKDIKDGVSYTVARVVENGYCVELHYNSNDGATIEYGTKLAHDYWENDIDEIDWFNTNLSDDYILRRLDCLYEDYFFDKELTNEKSEELNLIYIILHNHKVDDITLHIDRFNNIVAYDDCNFWYGKEFYDFMFNELFVYNNDNQVDLIESKDLKKLSEYKKQYEDLDNVKNGTQTNKIVQEMEIEI